MTTEADYRDWTITLPFTVPAGDLEGAFTEALFEAAVEHAPSDSAGLTARADTSEGKVWITFTLINTSQGLAQEIATSMLHRVSEAVLSGEDACISAS